MEINVKYNPSNLRGTWNCCKYYNPNLLCEAQYCCCDNSIVDDMIFQDQNCIEGFRKLDSLQAYKECPSSSLIYWNNDIHFQLKFKKVPILIMFI
jgi:hypothetical protein